MARWRGERKEMRYEYTILLKSSIGTISANVLCVILHSARQIHGKESKLFQSSSSSDDPSDPDCCEGLSDELSDTIMQASTRTVSAIKNAIRDKCNQTIAF